MTFSTLVVSLPSPKTVTFRADERYSLNWGLVDAEEIALPNGLEAKLISAGQSVTSIDVSGSLITVDGGDSADRQLFNDLHLLSKKSMGLRDGSGDYIKATLTQILNDNPASQVVLVGWVRDFIADRDAPEGLVEVKITFNFLVEGDPDISGLV